MKTIKRIPAVLSAVILLTLVITGCEFNLAIDNAAPAPSPTPKQSYEVQDILGTWESYAIKYDGDIYEFDELRKEGQKVSSLTIEFGKGSQDNYIKISPEDESTQPKEGTWKLIGDKIAIEWSRQDGKEMTITNEDGKLILSYEEEDAATMYFEKK